MTQTARVSTTDLDAMMEPLEAFFPGFTLSRDRDASARMDLAAYELPGVSMLAYRLDGARIAATTEALDFGVVDVRLRGAATSGRKAVGTDLPFALPLGCTAVFREARGLTVRIDAAEIRRHADIDDDTSGLHTLDATPVSVFAGRAWSTAAGFVRQQLESGAADSSPLIAAGLTDVLASTYLATFPTGGTRTSERAGSATLPAASLRRALAYVEDHAHEPISVADIAAAARMSVRGLQAALRRTSGQTPIQVLRATRLRRVRDDLIAADPTEGDTVETVARRWGFHHLGRFAGEYRRVFGELPSQTLRR